MNRTRVMAVLAALLIPGGFVALFGALAFDALRRTERGKRAIEAARRTVPAWAKHSTLRRTPPFAA